MIRILQIYIKFTLTIRPKAHAARIALIAVAGTPDYHIIWGVTSLQNGKRKNNSLKYIEFILIRYV